MKRHSMLCKWEELPKFMRTKEVFPYYKALKSHFIGLFIKRIFDFFISTILLFLLVPVFLIVALWVKLDTKGPIFYTQKRVTQYGRIFWIYKFRTMAENADQTGSLVTVGQDPRITRAGRWLRKYRLDELPQLMNIWKGEMSFVGTRPEVVRYVKQYTKEMYATLLMPAGVTSRASIVFKDEDRLLEKGMRETKEKTSPDEIYVQKILPEKMKYNLDALKEFCFLEELGLMCGTIKKVLGEEG